MSVLVQCCGNAEEGSGSRTPLFQRFSCGVGHVMNDFSRQLLISFRLVFFMKVLCLSAANAGWLMLYGALIIAAIMPVSAFLIDRISIPFLSRKFGRKKSWHFMATVVMAIVIPLYFSSCLPCQSSGEQWQLMLYIAMLSTCLAFAAATLEIGHLSIIPDIAKTQSEAVELNVWRFVFKPFFHYFYFSEYSVAKSRQRSFLILCTPSNSELRECEGHCRQFWRVVAPKFLLRSAIGRHLEHDS